MKKLIIFKKDINENKQPGNLCYVKFLDEQKNYAIFYNPLIAPKYFKQYIKENKIEEAYEVCDDGILESYKDKIYTFKSENGIYHAKKGFNETKKLVLLVDPGMDIELPLQKFSYEIYGNKIIINEYKKTKNKGYCYVADENEVSSHIKNAMIEVSQVVPNILYLGKYELSGLSKEENTSSLIKKNNKKHLKQS